MDRSDNETALRTLLATPRRIAVVGASPNADRDSHQVLLFLRARGHDAIPVNPVASDVAGVKTVPDLASAAAHWGKPPEIVDVFRAPEHLPAIVDETIEVGAPWLWCQLGVVHDEAIERALDAGLETVVDRCIKVESNRLV